MKTLIATLAAALLATGASADLMAPAAPTTIRGTITSVSGNTLGIKSNTGTALTLVLASDAKVAALSKVGIDEIKPNSFIGTAAKPGKNGTLEAIEVHVFPESMRGLGEGHRPWDLGKTSSMTNGNVGSVGAIKGHKGRTLTVDYKVGTQQVVVPASVPIVAFAEGTPAQLAPGAHVFAFAMKGADGNYAAKQIAVGVGGVVPPM